MCVTLAFSLPCVANIILQFGHVALDLAVVFANLLNFNRITFLYLSIMTFVLGSIVKTKQLNKTTMPVLIREQAKLKRTQNIKLQWTCLSWNSLGLRCGSAPGASL